MPVNSLCEAFKKKGITSQSDYIEEVAFQLSEAKALQAFIAYISLGTVTSVQINKVSDPAMRQAQ